jgi:tetratricopeptide (TPR) repeat protein
MWTDRMRTAPLFAALLGATALVALSMASQLAAEEGQYRSRILLTPNEGDWAKGTELSIEELEQQLGSIEEAYAKSSAGRHLARHYVERKEYDKAIAYYQQALQAQGLSAVANREMLRELAQVYLLQKDYGDAAQTLQQVLAIDLVPEVPDFLLLARAQHHLGRYVDVVATLDRMQQAGHALDTEQLQQALALYYRAGAFAQCEVLLGRLLELQPHDAQNWHLLASVYLQQNKKRQALDQLTLAREKRVPFAERDILLLANLHSANDNPYGAAQVLEAAMAQKEVPPNAASYRRLFEFWLQAREPEKARQALQQAASLSGDIELSLYLAQLQMEEQDFANMHETMLAACARELPDKYVGRANLLLGVSQLKLGDEAGARRSFINATLVGGVNAQAGQWLRFMNAAPVTDEEARRIAGICYGAEDKRLEPDPTVAHATVASVADTAAIAVASPSGTQVASGAFAIKTIEPMTLYYMQWSKPLPELVDSLQGTLISLYVSLVKSGGAVDGPLQIILSGQLDREEAEGINVQLGSPVRGPTRGSGKFNVRTTESFKCAALHFAGSRDALRTALAQLAESVRAAQHELTGEARIVIPQSDNNGIFTAELQIGIR